MYTESASIPTGFLSLCDFPVQRRGIVRQLAGDKTFANRAVSMGLVPGAEVTVIQNYGRGPLIISIQQARLALGRSEATQVLVEAA